MANTGMIALPVCFALAVLGFAGTILLEPGSTLHAASAWPAVFGSIGTTALALFVFGRSD